MNPVVWTPSPRDVAAAELTRFRRAVGRPGASYAELHRWSVEEPAAFWSAVWDFAGVIGEKGERHVVPATHPTDAAFFPDGRLNFAENLLQSADDSLAIVFRSEDGREETLTRAELYRRATAFAAWLTGQGVRAGDCVAGLLPNDPMAVIAMLGAAAVGAVWTCCSPDFGVDAILDRFGSVEPVVFVTATETRYAGKTVDVLAKATAVLVQLPSVRCIVLASVGRKPDVEDLQVPASDGTSPTPLTLTLSPEAGERGLVAGRVAVFDFAGVTSSPRAEFVFERFPFNHPLAVLYSSGTTGPPKGIVHGAGGTLLQHRKEHQLHSDVKPGDVVFFYTTTGWMMWNWLVTALAAKATIVLFDGSPFHPEPDTLFRLAAEHRVTHFGAGAKFYAAGEKAGVTPRKSFGLSRVRVLWSTGSPLLPASFDWLAKEVSPTANIASISGGTDIISCFALGCPTEPVRRGELQVKGLGLDVAVFDPAGDPIVGEPGELVCRNAFPSMPVGFWNDPEKTKYRAAYFGRFENIWCHGDWAEETRAGGFVIHGRSDATLNPGGVRIGTAELYKQVETFPQIADALAVPLRKDGDERIVLFVRMKPGEDLSADLVKDIKQRLRDRCSPRHVPAFVDAAPDLPRTVSGKLSEIAVREAIHGRAVANEAALANPAAVQFFRDWGRDHA